MKKMHYETAKNKTLPRLRTLLIGFIGLSALSCSQKDRQNRQERGLSEKEMESIEHLQKQNAGASIEILLIGETKLPPGSEILSQEGGVTVVRVKSEEIKTFESQVLESNPSAQLFLNSDVFVPEGGKELLPDENLLFSGKEEFGLTAWKNTFPQGDGRGVKIGVVDDGVAFQRAGLEKTSHGLPKISAIAHPISHRQIPLVFAPGTCPVSPAHSVVEKWKLEAKSLDFMTKGQGTKVAFYLDPCSINPYASRKPFKCPTWKGLLPGFLGKEGEKVEASVFKTSGSPASYYIAIDANQNQSIENSEVLQPLSQWSSDNLTEVPFAFTGADGRAFAFDVLTRDDFLLMPEKFDLPQDSCLKQENIEAVLTFSPPQSQSNGGSHGEGVAAIAAGFQIGGRNFDGVAPGAQIIDVPFNNDLAAGRYTIADVGRALRMAGDRSQIVNLSYSLFFNNSTGQESMNRFLKTLLEPTSALYFFSAGNNGPGIGTMNRGLIYPPMSLSVAAYLNGKLAQTTFGSATELTGVVSYSSRGPGLDGATSAHILSPLAGIVPQNADTGFGPFSGTSSATPAMSGFAARIISQIYAQGLPYKRDLLRNAILSSSKPLPNVPYIDQGVGIPQLLPTFETYKLLLEKAGKKDLPHLSVTLNQQPRGITARGIYIRGDVGKSDSYSFTITPEFNTTWSEVDKANFTQSLQFETEAKWIKVTPAMILGRSAIRFDVFVDWTMVHSLAQSKNGFFLSDAIKIVDADSKETKAIVPVTLVQPAGPQVKEFHLELQPAQIGRIFVQKPQGAQALVYSVESKNPDTAMCGVSMAILPNGERLPASSFSATPVRMEKVVDTSLDGVYELLVTNNLYHQSCAANQKLVVRVVWYGLQQELLGWNMDFTKSSERQSISGKIALSSQSSLAGVLRFANLHTEQLIPLKTSQSQEWIGTEPMQVGTGDKIFARLAKSIVSPITLGYPSLTLEGYANTEQRALFNTTLSAYGASTEVVLERPLLEAEKSVTLHLVAFDQGISNQTLPNPQAIFVATVNQNDSKVVNIAELPIQIRAKQSIVQNVLFDAIPDNLKNKKLMCFFKPDGFRQELPCGSVSFE